MAGGSKEARLLWRVNAPAQAYKSGAYGSYRLYAGPHGGLIVGRHAFGRVFQLYRYSSADAAEAAWRALDESTFFAGGGA